MRIITGILKPTSGRVHGNGLDIAQHGPETRRAIGFVSGDTQLYPCLSPRENLTYFGRLYQLEPATLRQRVDNLVDEFDMTAFAARPCQTLSSGQHQRANLARAFLHDPVLPLWSRLLIIVVTPALVAELLFRGLIFSGLRCWGLGPALGLSALLFALLHPPLHLFIPIFTMGIILGMVVWRTGSIFCSMVVHALNNGLMVIIVCFKPTLETWTWLSDNATPYPWCLGLLAILGLVLGLRLTWRNSAANQAPP
ncbi:MAG: CPBP family glutamic-type intramembrane protease [Verrucomicrobiota bacterium]